MTDDTLGPHEPWRLHIAYMRDHYGRRDPSCTWCGQPLYPGEAWDIDRGPTGWAPAHQACNRAPAAGAAADNDQPRPHGPERYQRPSS